MNENSLNDSRDQKLDQILSAIQTLDARVEQVETKVDERLRETRPIWDAVHVQLTEIKESVQAETQSRQTQISELKESVHAQVSELKGQMSEFRESVQGQITELKESQQSLRAEMEKSFRLLDRRMEMYADMVARVHAYERDLEDRVDELAKRLA